MVFLQPLSVLRLLVAILFLTGCSTQGGIYKENDHQHGEFSTSRTLLLPIAIAGVVVLAAGAASDSSRNQPRNSLVQRHSPTSFVTGNQQAIVVATTQGCGDWYVVENSSGFAMLQWFGGTSPVRGDTLVGDIGSFGMKDLLLNGQSTKAWVEDFMLTRSSVTEKITSRRCSFSQ